MSHEDNNHLPSFAELLAGCTFRLAWGKNRNDRNFLNKEAPGENLYAALTTFTKGPKDGPCLLQGELVKDGQRLGQRVARNVLMMVDHDTGETLASIRKKYEDSGVAALLYTTHSHEKPSSSVPEKAIIQHAKKLNKGGGHAADIDDAVVLDYLVSEKKYVEAVLFGSGTAPHKPTVTRSFGDNGVEFVVQHLPMARLRSVMLLAEPFDFADAKWRSQKEAIDIWKAKYAAVCELLDLPWDSSCTDPSRLMYSPRVSANAEMCSVGDGSTGHVIIDIPGAPLDLEGIDHTPYMGARRVGGNQVHNHAHKPVADNPFAQAAAEKGVDGASGEGPKFRTAGLLGFLKKYGHDFRPADLCVALDYPVRFQHETGFDSVCPNEEHHSTPDNGTSRDFMVKNAVDGEEGWTMLCLHQTCKDMSGEDRAWYLDLICATHNLSIKDLYEYSDTATREIAARQERAAVAEKAQKLAGNVGALRTEINAVKADTDTATVTALWNALAARGKNPETIELAHTLGKMRGLNKQTSAGLLTAAIRAFKDQAKEAQNRASMEFDHPDDGPPNLSLAPPIPKQRENANPIHLEWGADDILDCAIKRVHFLNDQDPKLYATPEGSTQRLITVDGAIRAAQMDSSDWGAAAADLLSFAQCDKMTGQVTSVFAPGPIVNYLARGSRMVLPMLESIMHVPVFAPDGSLVTEAGYNPALKMYLDPVMRCKPLPEVITPDHKEYAKDIILNGLLRDFPFSDAFDGDEKEPIKTDEVDEDGFKRVNWNRGPSSRAHMLAMMLQPFVRPMIDGPTPAFHIDKAAPGTGANYLADALAGILQGKRATPTAVSENNEELKKTVTAVMRERVPLIFFDNINHRMTSPHLAQVITTGLWKDRILGESTTTGEIPVKNVWLFAGNNLEFSHELYRRMVPIRLDAAVPNPAMDRGPKDFKYDLHKFVRDYRRELLHACHVLCGAWVQAGCPRGNTILASFDAWSEVMGGIMDVIGVEGFLQNRFDYLKAKDTEGGGWGELAQGIYDKIGSMVVFGASDVLEAFMGGMANDEWHGPIELGTTNRAKMAIQIGHVLAKQMCGRTFRFRTTSNGAEEGVLYKMVARRTTGSRTYQLVKQ